MQQLMTLWTQFQQAEKLHSEHVMEMEQRLKQVSRLRFRLFFFVIKG